MALNRLKKYIFFNNPRATNKKVSDGEKSTYVFKLKSVLGMDSRMQANENPLMPSQRIKSENFYDDSIDIPFYSNLSEQAVSNLVKKSKTVRYLDRWTMAAESHRSDSVYVIYAGKINVLNGDSKRTFVIQDDFTSLKEIAVLSDRLLSSYSINFERVVFSKLTKPEFANWLKEYPDVTFNVMENLCEKR